MRGTRRTRQLSSVGSVCMSTPARLLLLVTLLLLPSAARAQPLPAVTVAVSPSASQAGTIEVSEAALLENANVLLPELRILHAGFAKDGRLVGDALGLSFDTGFYTSLLTSHEQALVSPTTAATAVEAGRNLVSQMSLYGSIGDQRMRLLLGLASPSKTSWSGLMQQACRHELFAAPPTSTPDAAFALRMTLTLRSNALSWAGDATALPAEYRFPLAITKGRASAALSPQYPGAQGRFGQHDPIAFTVAVCGDAFSAASGTVLRGDAAATWVREVFSLSFAATAAASGQQVWEREIVGTDPEVAFTTASLVRVALRPLSVAGNLTVDLYAEGGYDTLYASGRLPGSTAAVLLLDPSYVCTEAACHGCPPCGKHGTCAPQYGDRLCHCEVGWTGLLCTVETEPSVAAVVAGGGAIVSVALDVALAQSTLAPIHTLTTLQLVYFIGAMDCGHSMSRHLTKGLWLSVRPFVWGVTGDRSVDVLATIVLVQVLAVALHGAAVTARYSTMAQNVRSWRAAKGRLLFPNVSIIIAFITTVPMVGALVNLEEFNGLVPLLGAWCVGSVAGVSCGLHWLLARRVGRDRCVEYLKFNMANSASNARSLIKTPSRRSNIAALFYHFLPSGYWSSRHLADRLFMRRYCLAFDEYQPASVAWFPLLAYLRWPLLAVLTHSSDAGCEVRRGIIGALSLAYVVLLLKFRPLKCSGSNLLTTVLHALFAASVFSMMSGTEAPVSASLCMLAVAAFAVAAWQCGVLVLTRRREPRATTDTVTQEEYVDDLKTPPHAAGMVRVLLLAQDTGADEAGGPECEEEADAILERASAFGELRYAELHSVVLVVFASPSSMRAEEVVGVKTAPLVFLGDRGILLLGYRRPGQMLALVPEQGGEGWVRCITACRGGGTIIARHSAPARVPRGDRRDCYTFYGEDVVTASGSYQACTLNGTQERSLMHVVRKSRLTAPQQAVLSAELLILAHLKSDFVVSVTNPHETETEVRWFVPYAELGSLSHHLKQLGPFRERDAAFWVAGITLGLQHLHENRLLFRNLTPSDVLFMRSGSVVLADPGVPREVASPWKAGYCAPEVLRLQSAQPQSDYFSLGCVLFAMLHNTDAFRGDQVGVVTMMVLRTEPKYSVALSPECLAVLRVLLSKNWKERQTLEKLKHMVWFQNNDIMWPLVEQQKVSPPLLGAPPEMPEIPAEQERSNPLRFLFEEGDASGSSLMTRA